MPPHRCEECVQRGIRREDGGELESAPTERAPAPPFPLAAACASLTELARRAGIAVTS